MSGAGCKSLLDGWNCSKRAPFLKHFVYFATLKKYGMSGINSLFFNDLDGYFFLRNGYRIRVQILRGTKRENNWNADDTDDADLRG